MRNGAEDNNERGRTIHQAITGCKQGTQSRKNHAVSGKGECEPKKDGPNEENSF